MVAFAIEATPPFRVVGLTPTEIDALLTKKYAEYIVGVDVTVRVAAGEAKKPDDKKIVVKGDFFKVRLDRERYVYDVIDGRMIGKGKTATPFVFLPEGECALLALLDYEVTEVEVRLTERPQETIYRIRLKTTSPPGLHAFRVQFFNPKKKEVVQYRTVLRADAGDAQGVFHFAVNDTPGEWTVKATDVLTGKSGEAKFTLK